jgi:hypothetical protein
VVSIGISSVAANDPLVIAGIEEYRCKVQISGSFYRTQAIKGTYCRRIAV